MSRYRQHRRGPNISPFFMWVLLICGIGYGIYKIDSAVKRINQMQKEEKEEWPDPDSVIQSDQTSITPDTVH